MSKQPDLEKVAMALYVYAAQLIKEGKTPDEIIEILVNRGVSQQSAETIVSRLQTSQTNVARRNGAVSLGFGVLIIIMTLFPLFGIGIERSSGLSMIVVIIVMASGFVIGGRGLLKIFNV